jgi:hypothetical protein
MIFLNESSSVSRSNWQGKLWCADSVCVAVNSDRASDGPLEAFVSHGYSAQQRAGSAMHTGVDQGANQKITQRLDDCWRPDATKLLRCNGLLGMPGGTRTPNLLIRSLTTSVPMSTTQPRCVVSCLRSSSASSHPEPLPTTAYHAVGLQFGRRNRGDNCQHVCRYGGLSEAGLAGPGGHAGIGRRSLRRHRCGWDRRPC